MICANAIGIGADIQPPSRSRPGTGTQTPILAEGAEARAWHRGASDGCTYKTGGVLGVDQL